MQRSFWENEKRKFQNGGVQKLSLGVSGTTRIRTGDTRIFSPMLYQLSYGTILFLFCECKGRPFFLTDQTFLSFFCFWN